MYGPYINVLIAEHASRHEGPVPPPHELVWLPWVGPFLRLFHATHHAAEDPLCACGHDEREHPLQGGCASCGCLEYATEGLTPMRQER